MTWAIGDADVMSILELIHDTGYPIGRKRSGSHTRNTTVTEVFQIRHGVGHVFAQLLMYTVTGLVTRSERSFHSARRRQLSRVSSLASSMV